MKKFSILAFLLLFYLGGLFFSQKASACDIVGAYDDNGCNAACGVNTGALGIDVNGLQYQYKISGNACSNEPRAITCIYSAVGHCESGVGPAGYNNGCKYDPTVSQQVACPTPLSVNVRVVDPQGNRISGVALRYQEEGFDTHATTDGNGLYTNTSSYSDDPFTILPNDPRYTFNQQSITGTVNTSWSCGTTYANGGTNTHGDCTFVATVIAQAPTNTPIPPAPTNTPIPPAPTNTPIPTDTPPPPSHTVLNMALQLPGIGIGGNLHPIHTIVTGHIQIYKATDDPSQPNIPPLVNLPNVTFSYNATTGYFLNATIDAGVLPSGSYQILVKVPKYLRKELTDANQNTKTFSLTEGQTTQLPATKLILGDVAPIQNVMDVGDFYAIAGCYGNKATTSTCAVPLQMADLNDDGVVDGIDLNYWLINMNILLQANNPGGVGDGVTGD